jgi:DNA modification methylase
MTSELAEVKGSSLSIAESEELKEHEAVIGRNLMGFVETGTRLLAIRDKGLYRDFGTFEEYCRERWGLVRTYAYEIIDAAKVSLNVSGIPDTPSLSAVSQARPLASLKPDEQREAWSRAVDSASNGKPTAAEVKAHAEQVKAERDAREKRKLNDLFSKAPAQTSEIAGATWEVRQGDCLTELDAIERGSARLIFADPPYNIGIDYGEHYSDKRDENEFNEWCARWIFACHEALSEDGSLWLLSPPDMAASLWFFGATQAGFRLRQWITWYESFGVNTTKQFNLCSRALLWLVKDDGRFVFNATAPQIRRASDRQAIYNDPRANPDGKLWDDVWGINPPIPRVVGTSVERMPEFPTQLPLALLRPIVACASEPGDLIVDPFSGSGTTGAACLELGRRYIGIELSERFAELSRLRLSGMEVGHDVR